MLLLPLHYLPGESESSYALLPLPELVVFQGSKNNFDVNNILRMSFPIKLGIFSWRSWNFMVSVVFSVTLLQQ